jgi:hypothetical protein
MSHLYKGHPRPAIAIRRKIDASLPLIDCMSVKLTKGPKTKKPLPPWRDVGSQIKPAKETQ